MLQQVKQCSHTVQSTALKVLIRCNLQSFVPINNMPRLTFKVTYHKSRYMLPNTPPSRSVVYIQLLSPPAKSLLLFVKFTVRFHWALFRKWYFHKYNAVNQTGAQYRAAFFLFFVDPRTNILVYSTHLPMITLQYVRTQIEIRPSM